MDNDRIRLRVLGISYNPVQSGAFALLLEQVGGPYKIPIVIGASEAQSIAIKIEGIITPRPMTHDLFCTFAQAYGIKLIEVFIYKLEDGIFASELKFSDGIREIAIDSRTSDAVALAMRFNAPIYTTREILEEAGTILEEATPEAEESPSEPEHDKEADMQDMSVEELRKLMEKCIEEEDYEEAAKISAIIKTKENQ